jgi:hypothetical protein
MAQGKTKNWGLQAALCGAVVVWQIYEMASATEAPSLALTLLHYFLLICGLIGGVGALMMMGRGNSAQS